jgi:hypothetical protein
MRRAWQWALGALLLLPAVQGQDPSPKFDTRFGGKKFCITRGGGGKDTEDAVLNSLRWLARHQRDDGSWNPGLENASGLGKGFPGTCDPAYEEPPAPPEEPLTQAEKDALAKWIAALGSDDPAERENATRKIAALDRRVLPILQESLQSTKDPEVRMRLTELVAGFSGSAGADTYFCTALALCAFQGAGYTRVANDTFDGIRFGDVAGKAARFLAKAMVATRKKSVLAQAMATTALCEAYAMGSGTGDADEKPLLEAATKACQLLEEMRLESGAWPEESGGVQPEGLTTHFSAWALQAGQTAGLVKSFGGLGKWAESLPEARDGDLDLVIGGGTARLVGGRVRWRHAMDRLIAFLPEEDSEPLQLVAASELMYQSDGPTGPLWKKWNASFKALLDTQDKTKRTCSWGSWTVPAGAKKIGLVATVACRALLFETYYRYPALPLKKDE